MSQVQVGSRHIPLLVRRGGCGIKKMSAKPTLAPQTGWSLTRNVTCERPPRPLHLGWLRRHFLDVASTPPHEEGNRPIPQVHPLIHSLINRCYSDLVLTWDS